ncbi:hypothetical protein ACFO4E_27900 [Nocardiopsis mangrovi]|uniref:Uncharacterized protein n=1 Tax=Nocardiopsis mangrovi TaxID=1179818 RepID=A0ABV9E3F2_9ACTN
MSDERPAEFSRERLGGRPVPDDLRILLTEHWAGRTELLHRVRLYDDEDDPVEHFARLADTPIANGIPMSTREYGEVYEPDPAVHPEELHDEINSAEFARLRREQAQAERG